MKIKQYISLGLFFVLLLCLIVVYRHEINTLLNLKINPVDSSEKDEAVNYVKCQTLKIGMTEADILRIMGKPNNVHYSDIGPQKNKKVMTYKNPEAMDDDNRIYIDTTTTLSSLIYCCNLEIK